MNGRANQKVTCRVAFSWFKKGWKTVCQSLPYVENDFNVVNAHAYPFLIGAHAVTKTHAHAHEPIRERKFKI